MITISPFSAFAQELEDTTLRLLILAGIAIIAIDVSQSDERRRDHSWQ